ncbi:PD40 domain-containing protein [Bacillus sp. JCM 19041]|uniref:TolB family protein n=1 Tax=Bacillus sp. JCM 19041 TaxID=1460637 RepID=UPI0006D1B400
MKQLNAESLYDFKTVTNPTVSADGNTAVVVVTEMNQEKNEYIANLHAFQLSEGKGETVQITYGEDKNIAPKWAPVGDKLAFLSNRSGKMQLFIKHGLADAKQLTDEKQGVLSFVWSLGGDKIAYTAMQKEVATEDSANDVPTPVVVDEMKYKSDARGLHDDSVMQVGLIDLNNGEQKWLTNAPYDVQLIDFSADSNAVLVAANRSANRDFTFSSDVWFIDITTLEETKVTKEPLNLMGGAVSPNGQHVVLLGHYREYENATHPSLYLFDLQTKSNKSLSASTDVLIGDVVVADFLQNIGSNQPVFSTDGNTVFTLVSSHGHANLWSYQLDGSVKEISKLEGHVHGFAVQNEQAIITYSDIKKPSEVYRLNISTGTLDPMTAFNAEVEQTFEINVPEPIRLTREDGSFVEGG